MAFLFDETIKKTFTFSFLFLFGFCLNGCSIYPLNTMRNDPLKPTDNIVNDDGNNHDNVFIGIAMSGGGSRASNFSAAVLWELDKLGILQHADVISSVSGSSLTAAYYGLYGGTNKTKNSKHPWTEEGIRKAFLTDFESDWFWDWLKPWNIANYWLSNFTRSDIMIDTLNDELYDDKKFQNLTNHPQIIINATSYTNGQPFTFTKKDFKNRLNSKLDTYPVANAVMASSAFPGVFHSVTLKDYSLKNPELSDTGDETEYFEHLIDGGPYDNLGVTSIIDILKKRNQKGSKPKTCLLIIVDAYPYPISANYVHQADTRNASDYLFDSGTVVSSTDVMLANNRNLILEKVTNFNVPDIGFKAFNPYAKIDLPPSEDGTDCKENCQQYCAVWHLTFQRLYDLQFEWSYARRNKNELQFLDRVRNVVNSIPTRYRLEESIYDDKPETVQDYIFKAANILVKKDIECNRENNECINNKEKTAKFTYQKVCELLKGSELKDIETCR